MSSPSRDCLRGVGDLRQRVTPALPLPNTDRSSYWRRLDPRRQTMCDECARSARCHRSDFEPSQHPRAASAPATAPTGLGIAGDARFRDHPNRLRTRDDGTGSAQCFACRAWVPFSGVSGLSLLLALHCTQLLCYVH